MNIFSKIKQNIEHGEVKITLQAAGQITSRQPALPVVITLSNQGGTARTIKRIVAEIHADENASTYGQLLNNSVQMGNTTDNNQMYSMQRVTVARAVSAEPVVLQPNESKTVTLTIAVNDPASPAAALAGRLARLTADLGRYKYQLEVSADVEAIAYGPRARQSLHIS